MSILLARQTAAAHRGQLQRHMSVVASVLRYAEFGDPAKVIRLEQETVPDPAGGQVLIKTLGAPINPADINTVQGEGLGVAMMKGCGFTRIFFTFR